METEKLGYLISEMVAYQIEQKLHSFCAARDKINKLEEDLRKKIEELTNVKVG